MKPSVILVTLFASPAIALAAVAQSTGLVSLQDLNPVVAIGGLVAGGVLAFACGDYAKRPPFRAGRTASRPARTAPTPNRSPVATDPLWKCHTYST